MLGKLTCTSCFNRKSLNFMDFLKTYMIFILNNITCDGHILPMLAVESGESVLLPHTCVPVIRTQ